MQNKKWHSVSASQISTYRMCPRKWYYDKIEGIPRKPDGPAVILGKQVHDEIERFIETGVDERGKIAKTGAVLLAKYLPAKAEVEVNTKIEGVPLLGYIDVVSTGTIVDHKTRGSMEYCKSEDMLEMDEQAIIYSKWYLDTYGGDSVDFAHHNYCTKKSMPAQEVKITMTRDMVLDKFAKLGTVVKQMAADSLKPLGEVKCVVSACKAYGGCDYADICTKKVEEKKMDQDNFDWMTSEITPKAEAKVEAKKEVKEEAKKVVEQFPATFAALAKAEGMTLCIDCYPSTSFEDLNVWSYELMKQLAKDTGETDLRTSKKEGLSFGKWKAVLAQAALLTPPRGVCQINSSELTEPIIEALSSVANLIVRGRR